MVRRASPVDRLAAVGTQAVDQSRAGHRLQGAIDGGEAYALAAAAELVVKFLGRPELVEILQ
jgi:hypothetical protein